jgi:hypothetical protein
MRQNTPKLSRGSAVIRCFVSLCLCMYLLGCSATHLDPATASASNSPDPSSPGSSGSGSGSSGSGSTPLSAINVIAPSGSSASSPVHYVATASTTCSGGVASIRIYTSPNQLAYSTSGASLDTNLTLAPGTYSTMVQSSDQCGGSAQASVPLIVSAAGSQTFSDIEQMSGWYTFPDQGNPICSSKPAITANPSLDGASGKFHLGPTGEFNNCLWPILLGSSTTATHFSLDTSYALSDPSAAQGLEFSSNKHIGTDWYKFSVQCSYHKGVFSVWDTAGAHWSPTTIPCTRPAANAWNHLTVLTAINNRKAVFVSLSLNGVTHAINQSFDPITKSSSYNFGVHFQMDGNRAGDVYDTFVDQMTFTAW